MAAKKQTRQSATPRPSVRPRVSDEELRDKGFTPFLRAEHVSDGEWLKATGFNSLRERDTALEHFLVEVETEAGLAFSLRIRPGSPDHRILYRTFGAELKRWIGGIRVKLVAGREAGRYFVNVEDADRSGPVWDGPSAAHDEREPGED